MHAESGLTIQPGNIVTRRVKVTRMRRRRDIYALSRRERDVIEYLLKPKGKASRIAHRVLDFLASLMAIEKGEPS